MAPRFDDDLSVVTRKKSELAPKKPRLYRVLMHNDDYTTREFVVWVLASVFQTDESEAVRIMLHVHQTGVGVAGVYTREVAETKVRTVEQLAKEHEYPLMLSMEPTEDEES